MPSSSQQHTVPGLAAEAPRVRWPFAVVLVAAPLLALCQREWINADLVAYASVAHRLLDAPGTCVTGCWSPLLSWLMVPLLWLGADDVLAARSVLILSGLLYVDAWRRLAAHWLPGDERAFARSALLVCSVLQAVLWSGSMVTADLVGNACLFQGLARLAASGALQRRRTLLGAGAWLGLAYLGKAYMLTFALPAIPLVLAWLVRRSASPTPWRTWAQACAWTTLAMLLVASPWIAVLSDSYDRFTIAEVGSTHHANVGPGLDKQDPMWNPPLGSHYVLHFHYGPDWSPFASWTHFCHQAGLIGCNGLRLLGHLAGWVAFVVVALVVRARTRRAGPATADTAPGPLVGLAATWTLLYPLGYLLIDTERRYVIPSMAPMLCLLAVLLWPLRQGRAPRLAFGLLLGLLFGWQELRLCWIAATHHNQMMERAPLAAVADTLRAQGLDRAPFAASDYHHGLGVAYLGGTQDHYVGRPQATDAVARDRELRTADVHCYLAYDAGDAAPLPACWRELPHDNGTSTRATLPRIFVRAD